MLLQLKRHDDFVILDDSNLKKFVHTYWLHKKVSLGKTSQITDLLE